MSNLQIKLAAVLPFIILVAGVFLSKTDTQRFIEKQVKEYIKTQIEYGINNAAVIVMDPKTLKIVAKTGAVFKPHTAGSVFKPVVYAAAFEKGWTPETAIMDEATNFDGYVPRNFDDAYLGKITVKTALSRSRNIPAVKTYFFIGGQKLLIEAARRMGIASLRDDFDYGPPLALGSAKISLMEMTRAYAVFASGGLYRGTRVLDEKAARAITDILSDDDEKMAEALKIPGIHAAVKTGTAGTTKDGYLFPSDAWTIGYTDRWVVGVWLGRRDGGALEPAATGGINAAPL